MKFFDKIRDAIRGYFALANPTGQDSTTWPLDTSTEEADLHQNHRALHGRMDSLARENSTFTKYHWTLMASVFGENGLMFRSQVVEDEDREIDAKEKAIVRQWEERRNRVLKWSAEKNNVPYIPFQLTRETDEELTRAQNGSGKPRKATLKAGSPDVAANQLIMRKWKEWQEAQYCDLRGQFNYASQRHVRLWSAVRRGEMFVRMISDPKRKVNKFGFTLQLINSEWCDRYYNGTLPSGNEVRQGIEYERTPWGVGKPVAYYFIERTPRDWQWMPVAGMSFGNAPAAKHTRIPASEIIHYKRATDADTTRPGPWAASCIPTAKHLADYSHHAVIAAREACMTVGWMESTLTPDAAEVAAFRKNNPTHAAVKSLGKLAPGAWFGLPAFTTAKRDHPEHPTTTFSDFANWQGRYQSAGMPGASYSDTFSDYAQVTFSSGKLEGLSRSAVIYLMQRFDIDYAETPIFRQWLYMALLVGELAPLPFDKFEKFCQPFFQGPKLPDVDEVKAVTASAFRIGNNLSNWTLECGDSSGLVWEDVILTKKENEMLMEQLGINHALVTSKPMPANDVAPASEQQPTAGEGKSEEEIGFTLRT